MNHSMFEICGSAAIHCACHHRRRNSLLPPSE